jgi:hypothetical protein
MWLANLGFPELRTAFTGNKMDGVALKSLTMEKLAEDYGVSEEDQRKKIYYNLKDVLRKDNAAGNTNHYSQMFFWLLPLLGIYKYLTLRYEKQIEKAMKKYKKWQDARNPPAPVEIKTFDDGTNEWTRGLNRDVNLGPKKTKAEKDEVSYCLRRRTNLPHYRCEVASRSTSPCADLLVRSLTGEEGQEDQDAEGGMRACMLRRTPFLRLVLFPALSELIRS